MTSRLRVNTIQSSAGLSTITVGASSVSFGDIEASKLTASTGILFGTDTAAANTLDDYEEGTWTPTFLGNGTEGSGTYTIQGGRYTKLGAVVHVSAYVRFSNKGDISGDIAVGGLPFVQRGTSNTDRASLNIGSASDWNTTPYGCVVNANADSANLNNNMNGGSTLTDFAMTNTSFVFITGTYLTDS